MKIKNHEITIIDWASYKPWPDRISYDGIVLNAGAYTHTSVAIYDAIQAIDTPVVEVHISNIFSREAFRHRSLITSACVGVISGFGLDSYRLAVEAILAL